MNQILLTPLLSFLSVGTSTPGIEYTFFLHSNALSSSIPSQLGNLDKMISKFGLGYNSFTSSIPSELGRLVDMFETFDLKSNKLTSVIPTELGE